LGGRLSVSQQREQRTENEWCILRLVFRKHRADWVR
jgi:hypothetical protein